ncbi:hypothetical protein HRS9122_07473 [Pyrenophora teres f. teres]|nr:hypothetical protein HRS9122_07473 [Pyrenophora teres f. teres]
MIRALFILLNMRYAVARFHHGLPHKVLNVTQTMSVFVAAPVTVNSTTTETCPAPTSTVPIYSTLYPSPNAAPVEITAQSQVVTSYIPQMTWCVGPPIELIPMTGPPYLNGTTEYSTIIAGTGSCETMYSPLETTVCATTLTGLGSKIPVTACDQEITFSTECGFTVEKATPITTSGSLITPAPSVKRVQTFWLAPWQSFTAGEPPSDVEVKICTDLDDGRMECIRYQEVWEVVVVTSTRTTEHTVQISTTVSGPGTLIVATATGIYTDTIESIDLSTVLLLETEIETESISSGRKPTATVRTTSEYTSTVYITRHLHHASSRQVAGFDLALAAAVPRRDVATHTITKTIYYTEVRKLSTNLTDQPGRSAEVATTEQLSKRDKTVRVNSKSTHDSGTDLFNLRVDLASEGYISIYVPSVAVSSFCDGVLKQEGDAMDIHELLLAVYNATNAVKIPVHRGDATSFCKLTQNKNGPKSSRTSSILSASDIASAEEPAMSSSVGDTLESTTSSHKLKAFKTSASKTDLNSSDISTPTLSNTVADNSASSTDDPNDSGTSTSAKKAPPRITSSVTASATPESAMNTPSDAMSSDDTVEAPAILHSSLLPSKTSSADDASTEEETSSEALATTVSQASEADESEVPAESTSSKKKKKISTSIESDASIPQPTDDASSEEAVVETSSIDDSSEDSSTDDSDDSTPLEAATANVLGAADPIPHLTVSSINSWYNVINSYMSSATATASMDLDVDAPSATADSIDSENGAARRGIRRTVIGNPALTVSSMNSWYDYISSYMRTAGTPTQTLHTATSRPIARSKPSSNAGVKRVTPLSLLWRKDKRQYDDDSDDTAGDEDDTETPTSTSTHHKPKPTKTHPSDPVITKLGKGKGKGKGHTGASNPDKEDGEKTERKTNKSTATKGHPKETQTPAPPKNAGQQDEKNAAPTLPSDLSFALATPTTKNAKQHSTTASIPAPPPGTLDTPSGVIIWDPECIVLRSSSPSPSSPSHSPSNHKASSNSNSNADEKRGGDIKGCWRTPLQSEHVQSSNAWNILSDRQNRHLWLSFWR